MQVNLGELLKQTGIVGDDESFFMDDEPPLPPPPMATVTSVVPPTQPQPTLQLQLPMITPVLETKESNNVYLINQLLSMILKLEIDHHKSLLKEHKLVVTFNINWCYQYLFIAYLLC